MLLASYMERKKQLVTTEAASLVSANYQTIWEQIEKQTSRKVMVEMWVKNKGIYKVS